MNPDFSRLGQASLTEFLTANQRPVPSDSQELISASRELFEELRTNPEAIFPIKVVDLFLLTQFLEAGGVIDKVYTVNELTQMNEELKGEFGLTLGLDPADPDFTARLIDILTIAGAIVPEPIGNIAAWSCPIATAEGDTVPLLSASLEIPDLGDNSEYEKVQCLGDGNCFFHAFLRGVDDLYISSYDTMVTITEQELRDYEQAARFKFKLAHRTITPSRNSSAGKNPETVYTITNPRSFARAMMNFRTAYACAFRQGLATYIRFTPSVHAQLLELFPTGLEILTDEVRIEHFDYSEEQINREAFHRFVNYYANRIGENRSSIEPDILILISELYDYDIYVLSDQKLQNPESTHPFPDRDLLSYIRGPQSLRLPPIRLPENRIDEYLARPDRSTVILLYTGGNEGHYDLVVRVNYEYEDDTKEIIGKLDADDPLVQKLYSYASAYQQIEIF